MVEWLSIAMFGAAFVLLLLGYPVAPTLAGIALAFAAGGMLAGVFAPSDIGFLPARLFGLIDNQTLIAVPLFILMGVILEKSRVAEKLLESFSLVFGRLPGGLGVSVTFVGMLMAASTGIVGATVVTMGLMSLPTMLRHGWDPRLATGTIAATGTLGQIIPPSIALVLLGDVLGSAYQQAQLQQGIYATDTVSVGDLFAGALLPGLLLVGLYMAWVSAVALTRRDRAPTVSADALTDGREVNLVVEIVRGLAPPLALIIAVLGSILFGFATPTEASGVGAFGAMLLALLQVEMSRARLSEITRSTAQTTAMVFFILIGASVFSLVFRGYGGDDLVRGLFDTMPGGVTGATLLVMAVIFFLGFILDFIEITYVVVPIVGPKLLAMGLDPVWFGIMIAVNLQTSFLTPPFGFALFYLRGVAPSGVRTMDIYRGVIPFVLIQLFLLALLALWPALATWLPGQLYG